MPEHTPRFWEVFFDVFEALPHQGPGNGASAARALALCPDLPPSPTILDMGCGVGGRTIAGRPRAGGFIPDASCVAPCMHRPVGTVPA